MPLPAIFDHQSVSIHPQTAGFTARYVWRGRNRDAIWRCCNMDAQQSTVRVKHDEVHHMVTITRCSACHRTTDLRITVCSGEKRILHNVQNSSCGRLHIVSFSPRRQ